MTTSAEYSQSSTVGAPSGHDKRLDKMLFVVDEQPLGVDDGNLLQL